MGTGRHHVHAGNPNVIDLASTEEGDRVLEAMHRLGHSSIVGTTPSVPEQRADPGIEMIGGKHEPAPQLAEIGHQKVS